MNANLGNESHPTMIDLAELDTLVGGDKTLAMELLVLVETEIPNQAERLTRAARNNDRVEIHKTAHRLKGSLLNVGATSTAAHAAALESSAVAATDAEISQLADAMNVLLEALVAQVRELRLGLQGNTP